jgi:hypothetical protein
LAFKHHESEVTAKQFIAEYPEDVLELFSTAFDGRDCPAADPLFKVLARFEPESRQINALLLKEFIQRPTMAKAIKCLRRKDFDLTPVNQFVLSQVCLTPLCISLPFH